LVSATCVGMQLVTATWLASLLTLWTLSVTKRIEIDGKFYRERRGKLVEIPAEWVGSVTHPQTMRKRPSKQIGKLARTGHDGSRSKFWASTEYKDRRDASDADLRALPE
jgi:hypothetical protein